MPINDKQKIILMDINAATLAAIQQKLQEGFVIHFIINLQPSINKLLIVYVTPEEI